MAPAAQKINLKDKIEDGEIDLSLSDLQDVPVKEIAAVRKAHSLDLSNNHISVLPKTFPTLVNLIKLDLSKNQLRELPDNFGELIKLKHLDLYKNQLQHLPLSFNKLKALKWLDLKDNPLMPAIANIAGPCLENKQCQKCAKDIVAFYSQLQVKVDEEKKVREAQRQKSLEANAQKMKQEKKNKKDKKNKVIGNKENDRLSSDSQYVEKNVKQRVGGNVQTKRKPKNTLLSGIFSFIIHLIMITIFIGITLFVLTAAKVSSLQTVEDYVVRVWNNALINLPPNYQSYGSLAGQNIKYLHNATGETVLILIHHVSQLKENDTVNIIFTELTSIAKNVTQTASKFYVKLFGKE